MARWLLVLAWLWPPLLAADIYLDELIAAARAQKLAAHPYWHTLLHYKPRRLLSGVKSQADDPAFFNAPDGKTNPAGELEATLAAFFADVEETDTRQHPQCRFIARYHWLKEKLAFDPARLPPRPCRRFHEWRAALNPEALTLVFPAAYLNNPASAYGHTFLRVDARDQDERTRLLAYAVNYAAATDDTNGVVFAIKGIFGGYPGVFSISPYYMKVTEYNDLENRDIWEYELDFSAEEIDRLLRHAWELGRVRFDYYFFDENCSYHLLSLFDAARPELRWTDRFPAWVIPADTVRVVTDEAGMLRRAAYRPARSTVLRHRARHMPAAHVRLAKTLALAPDPLDENALAGLSPRERARVLELGYEYLEYLRLRGRAPDSEQTAARLRALLLARSRIDVPDDVAPPAPRVRPDQGHRSARVRVGIGRENGQAFQELHVRPAYHDLLDPEAGYNRGAAIEFLGVTVRHRERDDRARVERLDLINITSISPRDELLKPLSWKINVGLVRKRLPAREPLVFRMEGGPGLAWEDAGGRLWYAMIEAALDVDRELASDYALGAGPAVGAVLDVTRRWRVQLEARALRYGVGDVHSATQASLNQRLTLTRQSALRLEVSRRREFSQVDRQASLSWSYYF